MYTDSPLALRILLILSLTTTVTWAHAGALTIEAGQVVGATGLDINGDTWNATFHDGTCEDLFDGCDSASDFDFDQAGATAAATALLALFAGTIYDSSPDLTSSTTADGCTASGICFVFIPYTLFTGTSGDFRGTLFANRHPSADSVTEGVDHRGDNAPNSVFALFSRVVPTPEPTSGVLALGAVAALLLRRRSSPHT